MSPDHPSLEVRSPATGEVLGAVPNLGADEVHALAARARAAQPAWAGRGPRGRGALLNRFRHLLADRAQEAADLSSRESGKTVYEALMGDVESTLDLARFYARRAPRVLSMRSEGSWIITKKGRVIREPYGVIGVISPWNLPIFNPMRVVMAALATGNTVVLKPSELSPMSAVLMRQLAIDAGIPEDVFLVATGDAETGKALVAADVDKVSFIGSAAHGRAVAAAAAERMLPVTLELGGKNAMIVLADANLDRAVNLAVQGSCWNAGQLCIAMERFYVEAPVYDAFVQGVTRAVEALAMATESDPEGDISALTTDAQVERLERHVADAREKGGKVLAGGGRLPGPGRHFAPTVVADADSSMAIMREESFGPVLPIMKVADAEEAIRLTNDSPYGLAAAIFTRRRRGERLARLLRAGMVSVNDVLYHGAIASLPFGGQGESGYGRVHGEEGLMELTRTRTVVTDRAGFRREPVAGFPFRRFGEAGAHALIRVLHGHGILDRLRAVPRLIGRLVHSLRTPS